DPAEQDRERHVLYGPVDRRWPGEVRHIRQEGPGGAAQVAADACGRQGGGLRRRDGPAGLNGLRGVLSDLVPARLRVRRTRWPKGAAKGRISLVEGLMAVTPVLVTTTRGAPDPDVLRQAMRKWAFNPLHRDTPRPPEIDAALSWLARASMPVSALHEAT